MTELRAVTDSYLKIDLIRWWFNKICSFLGNRFLMTFSRASKKECPQIRHQFLVSSLRMLPRRMFVFQVFFLVMVRIVG